MMRLIRPIYPLFYVLAAVFVFSVVALNASAARQKPSIKLISTTFQTRAEIDASLKWNHDFISIEDLAYALHLGVYTNESKRKSVLYLEKERITFSANNTFIKFNDQIVQIKTPCLWRGESVWIPIADVAEILDKYTAFNVRYDIALKKLNIERTDANILAVRIREKENGTLINLLVARQFAQKDIILDVRNGWFHIDIFGGIIDTTSIGTISPAGVISEIQGFQLGETAALSFKLKKPILARELVFEDNQRDFHVNLRTKDIIAKNAEKEQLKSDLDKQRKKWLIDTIVLDAGHGGKDPGAIGFSKKKEKDIALSITRKLGKILQEKMPGIQVVYTRKKDVFIPLWKRTKIANDVDADLFISIHCNSNRSSRPNGFETYFLSADKESRATDVVLKENAAIEFEESTDRKQYEGINFILAKMLQSDNVKRSQFLASHVQQELNTKLGKLGMTSRGVKQGPFWVMVGATMPNILIETGYISNKHEERLLLKETTQKKIAEAIVQGIKDYKEHVENSIRS